jgi:hypothetical protein
LIDPQSADPVDLAGFVFLTATPIAMLLAVEVGLAVKTYVRAYSPREGDRRRAGNSDRTARSVSLKYNQEITDLSMIQHALAKALI